VSFPDHFSAVAARYAQYRPHYPAALVELLAELAPRRDAVWDAGCGNGQLSVALAAKFAHVYATDGAQAQLDAAIRHPLVEYRRAVAEDCGLPDASVDLATVAQAAHWFDWARYVAEVGRVARSGAVVAAIAYGNCFLDGPADTAVRTYYADLGHYWPPNRVHIENGYRDLVWPWPVIEAKPIEMTASWTREELTGYLATWSATQRLAAAEGLGRYDAVCAELAALWPDGERRLVRWPLTVRLARR
jgi:SAM-dependent methyltransferase